MEKIFFKGLVTKSNDGKYKVLASTSAIDRQGDSIDQNGWDLTNFKTNPVMPWAHDYSELPVAKATSIEITKRGLEVEFEFAPSEGNPKAQQVKVLYDEGYLNAVSVGFIPKERKGNVITKAELLEISFVPVPANQEALRLAMKSLDISEIEKELKGAVENEMSAEEIWEQKREKFNQLNDIFSAFWKVYFDEATPVEDFDTLLAEVIVLLGKIGKEPEEAPGEEGEPVTAGLVSKAISEESLKAFSEFIIEKAGRTLSKKTLDSINAALEGMKSASSALDELVKVASSEDQGGEKTIASSDQDELGAKVPEVENLINLSLEDLKIIRQNFVAKDKTNEVALSIVNAFIKQKIGS